MHGPYSQEGSWLGSSPNDALQKIIRVQNTHATVHLAYISTKGNFKKSKAKQLIEDLL